MSSEKGSKFIYAHEHKVNYYNYHFGGLWEIKNWESVKKTVWTSKQAYVGAKIHFLVRQNLRFSPQMHHNFRQNSIFLPQATWLVKAMAYFVYNNQKLKSSSKF